MKQLIYITIFTLLLVSCHKVKPQGPANKPEADSAQLALFEFNFRMAEEADVILVNTVKASGLPYVLDNSGFWYLRQTQTDGEQVEEGMKVEYTAEIRELNGTLIEDITNEITVGRMEALRAIDRCLPNMRVGEEYLLLAPFYGAYGRDGQNGVKPFVNVRIKLTVNNIIKI